MSSFSSLGKKSRTVSTSSLRKGKKKPNASSPVPDLELRDHVRDLHQDHRAGHQRQARGYGPLAAPVLDVRADVAQLASGLRDGKDERKPSLVELKARLALRPLLSLELLERGEGRSEELEDDGGVDVGDDPVFAFFF